MHSAVLTHTFNIHEIGVRTLHQPLLLVFGPFFCQTWMHQILNIYQSKMTVSQFK